MSPSTMQRCDIFLNSNVSLDDTSDVGKDGILRDRILRDEILRNDMMFSKRVQSPTSKVSEYHRSKSWDGDIMLGSFTGPGGLFVEPRRSVSMIYLINRAVSRMIFIKFIIIYLRTSQQPQS